MNEDRIDRFIRAFEAWISRTEGNLDKAISQSQTQFKASDIHHRLLHLKDRVTKDALINWVSRSSTSTGPKTCLCLHAGNLPLVGFQDVLAVWLAGHRYVGKLSRRDPWLMASFLEVLRTYSHKEELVWATTLEALPHIPVDKVLFSGSEVTVPLITNALQDLCMLRDHTEWLVRTASFSVAWLQDPVEKDLTDLAEAILRYDGSGCRSVKVVICNHDLNDFRCALEDAFEGWWSTHGGHRIPSTQTIWDKAYLQAIERPHVLVEHLLLAGLDELTDNSDRILWIKGGEDAVSIFTQRYSGRIQALYGCERTAFPTRVGAFSIESLRRAQDPDIDWKADGKEVLTWLS